MADQPARPTTVTETPEQAARRDLFGSFGDAWFKAMELALVPVVFGLVGHWLDRRLGWTPVLTLVFVLYAVVGGFLRLYYAYKREAEAEDAAGPWARGHRPAGAAR